MKRLLAALLLVPLLAVGAGSDLIMTQRNPADTGQLTRIVAHPVGITDGLMGYNGSTQLPVYFAHGPGLSVATGVVDTVPQDWATITGKPTFAAVAASGAYADLTGAPTIPAGTVTSITAGAGLSGGVITSSGTISLPNTGTAGSYSGVTTDAQGRVTAGTNRSQSSASRSLNSAFQISASRDAMVSYSVQITVTASIGGGQNGDVILEIASDSGFTANVQTIAIAGTGQTYTLAIALQGVQPQTGVVSGFVPAGYYARLRTVNNTGTPSYLFRVGQEVLQ